MKIENRHSLTALVKGAVAITTATAVLLGQTVSILAASATDERKKSENAVKHLKHIIIIYQENWSFDALYAQFPGANGYGAGFSTLPQYDVHASPPYSQLIYKTPLPLNGGPDPNFPASPDGNLALSSDHNVALPLIPYTLTQYIPADAKTGDLVHRFYHEQLQIDNGVLEAKLGDLDKFVTWSDNPGLVLNYIDATNFPEGQLAQQFTLCDNFFHSAYGGSFLNHQFLIAANAPQWTQPVPTGWQSSYDPNTKTLSDA
jgi:phospholipase C